MREEKKTNVDKIADLPVSYLRRRRFTQNINGNRIIKKIKHAKY